MLHQVIPLGEIHAIHNWEVDDAAALAALVPIESDRGKLAWQLDTNEFYFLVSEIGPVWAAAIGIQGIQGDPGVDGFTLLNGAVAPTTEGVDGDFYIDTVLNKIHGPKAAGAWPAGVSLVGPTGATGASGIGVPAAGDSGQVLAKVDGDDYNIEWVTPSSSVDMLSTLVNSEVSITGAVTLTSTAFGKMHVCSGTSANYTVGLPAVAGNAGKLIGIRMAASLTKLVTLDANAAETIDGSATRIMWAKESAILLCDGASWTKIAGRSVPMSYSAQRLTAVAVATGTAVHVPTNTVLEALPAAMANASFYCSILRSGKYTIAGMVSYEKIGTVLVGYETYCALGINNVAVSTTGPSALAVVPSSSGATNTYAHPALSLDRSLTAGDYVALLAYQSTGQSLNTRVATVVTPRLSVTEIPSW